MLEIYKINDTKLTSFGDLKLNNQVDILLATYNGSEFIEDQLNSIEEQTHKNWRIWASDDGSTDGTIEILEKWALKLGSTRLIILKGPGKGFVKNFQFLISNSNLNGSYIAFCDQDDVWMNDKLERAINFLYKIDKNVPALYCSRTEIIDINGHKTNRLSPLFNRKTSFDNALVQSIAGGNTMVLNNSARNLMAKYSKLRPVSHDWWAYLIVTGVSGNIIYDHNPSIYYRQHENNIIGENKSLISRFNRFKFLMNGGFYDWNNINISCLEFACHSLTDENNKKLNDFKLIRSCGFFKRFMRALNNSFYRQTRIGNIGLIIGFLMKKI